MSICTGRQAGCGVPTVGWRVSHDPELQARMMMMVMMMMMMSS